MRRKLAKLAAFILFAYITCQVAWSATARSLEDWGHRARPAAKADCLIVLGARVVPPGVAGPALQTRAVRAAELYAAGIAPHTICTGGMGGTLPPISTVATEVLIAHGVPAAAIAREEVSTTTWENATEAAAICRQRGWKRVILVSDAYHLWRAARNFRAQGLEVSVAAAQDAPAAKRKRLSRREALLVAQDFLIGRW